MKEFIYLVPGALGHSLEMHHLILKGLIDRDEALFMKSIKTHLQSITHCLVNYYSEQGKL